LNNFKKNTHNSIPNAQAAVKIAQALGITVEYLVTGRDSFNGKKLASLPKDLHLIINIWGRLNKKNRKLALALLKTLEENEAKSAKH